MLVVRAQMKLSYLGIGALLAACSDPSSEQMPPDTMPGARTITAHEALTFRGADGATTDNNSDLDRAVIQALVRAADGTWQVFPGEGSSEGVLVIHDVPAGEALVRIDYYDGSPEPRVRNEYFFVGGDGDVDIDLGTWRNGRLDARYPDNSTDLALDMSGLAPWQPGNDLAVFYEPNVNFVNLFFEDGADVTGMPTAGATASQLHIDWLYAVGGPLANEDRGDRSYLMQFRFRDMAGVRVGAPVRAVALPAFTQIDGDPLVVPAALGQPTPLRVRVAMDRDAFDNLRTQINPTTSSALGRGFAISSSPSDVTHEFSRASLPAELVVLDEGALDGTGLFDVGDLDVASPFPANTVYGNFATAYEVRVPRPDGFVAFAQAQIGVLTNTLPTADAPATPIISPVRVPTVGGKDAFSFPTGVGVTPEIAWQAPALGTPVEYEVKILAPGGADQTYGFLWYPAATFHVPGDRTSLQLPRETLQPDLPYAIAIRAITQPLTVEQLATTPRSMALPYGWADTITTPFQP
jgi:hypothetical protein